MAHFHYYGSLFVVNGILLSSVSMPCASLSFKSCMNIEQYLISYSLLNLVLRSHFSNSPCWLMSCTISVDFFIFFAFKLSVLYRDFGKYWVNTLNGGIKSFRVKATCCRLILVFFFVTKYKLAVLLCTFCNIFTNYSHQ